MTSLRRITALAAVLLGLAAPARAGDLVFDPLAAPFAEPDKQVLRTTSGASLDGRRLGIAFTPLMTGGSTIGAGRFAELLDSRGRSMRDKAGKTRFGTSPDFTSLLKADSGLFAVSHIESLPGALYLTQLAQNRQTGAIKATDTRALNLAHIGGIYNPCAGMVTPWGTHLGGEEFPADVREFDAATNPAQIDGYVRNMLGYLGLESTAPMSAIRQKFKPYRYGFPFEVKVRLWRNVTIDRHYAMGRFSHELAYVLPDRRTVYMSDDGTNTGLFMYYADREGDLSAGRLFAARWEQTTPPGSPDARANITWIDLGHATSRAIQQEINRGVTFSDLFDAENPAADGSCPTGFRGVNFYVEGTKQAGECLRVKPGKEMIASRLETRRYAAYLAATTEFRKMEGITYDPGRKRLYVSMTEINRGMLDGNTGTDAKSFDRAGPNHIRLARNHCGVVFGLDLSPDAKIGSPLVAKTMAPVLVGEANPDKADKTNTCRIDRIAGPDNLTFIPEHDTLVVAEDSNDEHENNAVWAYDVGRQRLTRIMTVAQGAEASGVYWHQNINGFSYLSAIMQHPFGEAGKGGGAKPPSDDPRFTAPVVGLIGPFPVAPVR